MCRCCLEIALEVNGYGGEAKEQGWAEEVDGQEHRADDEDENGPSEFLKAAIMDYHRLPQVTSEYVPEGSR